MASRLVARLASLSVAIPRDHAALGNVISNAVGGRACGRSADVNVYVIDGAAVGANLGVNPSLTITALAERAMAQIPNKAGG